MPSPVETDEGQNNHLSRQKHMEDIPAAERGFQRVETMEQDGADGGGFPRRTKNNSDPSTFPPFTIWENKGWPLSSGRLNQLKGWPSVPFAKRCVESSQLRTPRYSTRTDTELQKPGLTYSERTIYT